MTVSGTATLNAPAERVFATLTDPAVLVRAIPWCEQLEALGGDRYRVTITSGTTSTQGTCLYEVALIDPRPPSAFRLKASGSGAPGTVSAEVRITLDDQSDGTTLLRYDADALVGGQVGEVGEQVPTETTKRISHEVFDAVNALLASPTGAPTAAGEAVVAAPSAQGAPVTTGPGAGEVFRSPSEAGARLPSQVKLRDQLPGLLVGAMIALLGVIVGWLLRRTADRGDDRTTDRGDGQPAGAAPVDGA
jgi:carbon monoxide dehydrogenase subunit G